MKKIKLITLISILIVLFGLFFLNSVIGVNKFSNLRSLSSHEQRQLVKKYIFPYKFISQLEEQQRPVNVELQFKEDLEDTVILKNLTLSNGKVLERFMLYGGFDSGINKLSPGSGYIDFYDNNIFILSARGVLVYAKNLDDVIRLKQIKNNINEFIGINQFSKGNSFSLKDILISKNKIFISYNEEIKEDCWNTSIIYGDINYKNIQFKKLFSPKECVHTIKNIDKEFNGVQAGGRMVSFDNNHLLLTIGDYRSRHLAQAKESVNGKILKININNSEHEIISMGHRNPQGLYFDKVNNFILETEHGPFGGDEINILEINKINKNEILNYGWPISSAGKHYSSVVKANKNIYEKYPLYKSHSKYGFIEPLKTFGKSIGISEITKIGKNEYVVSSMKDKSLYFFELDKEKKIVNLDRIEIFERVRDLNVIDNKLYLFLETSASIGIIKLN